MELMDLDISLAPGEEDFAHLCDRDQGLQR